MDRTHPLRPSSYLRPEDVADRLSEMGLSVRPVGKGWMAQCPAHEDREPSLRIDPGHSGTLLYCHTGCQLDEICASLNIHRAMLFHDYNPDRSPDGRAERELAELARKRRPPTVAELRQLNTLQEVLDDVLDNDAVSPEQWVKVGVRWADFLSLPYAEVMGDRKTRYVVVHAIVPDLLERQINDGYDYDLAARLRLVAKMAQSYRRSRGDI